VSVSVCKYFQNNIFQKKHAQRPTHTHMLNGGGRCVLDTEHVCVRVSFWGQREICRSKVTIGLKQDVGMGRQEEEAVPLSVDLL